MHAENSLSGSCKIEQNLDCYTTFPINFAPKEISFGAKTIGKVKLQSKFGSILQDSELIPHRKSVIFTIFFFFVICDFFSKIHSWCIVTAGVGREVLL